MLLRKSREPRRLITVKARMQNGKRQSDVVIGNVSTRGLMGKCANPPAKGAEVEIRHGALCISGRVIWSKNRRFGLESDAAIDVAALFPPPEARASRRFVPPGSKPASRPAKPVPRRRAASKRRSASDRGSLRDMVVAVLVAVAATSVVELGYLNPAWNALRLMVG